MSAADDDMMDYLGMPTRENGFVYSGDGQRVTMPVYKLEAMQDELEMLRLLLPEDDLHSNPKRENVDEVLAEIYYDTCQRNGGTW